MDAHEYTPLLQVLSVSDTGRRRRWSDDEKMRIVDESLCAGVTLAEVARRHDISRSQLYDWRYRRKHGLLGPDPSFLRVFPVGDAPVIGGGGVIADHPPAAPVCVMTIDLGPRCRVMIPSGFDMDAAAHLLNGLRMRS